MIHPKGFQSIKVLTLALVALTLEMGWAGAAFAAQLQRARVPASATQIWGSSKLLQAAGPRSQWQVQAELFKKGPTRRAQERHLDDGLTPRNLTLGRTPVWIQQEGHGARSVPTR